MTTSRAAILALAAMGLGLAACATASPGEEVRAEVSVERLPLKETPGVDQAADAALRLGWQVIASGEEPNRIVSPSSLGMSLAMVGEGAEGVTALSIDEALGMSGDARSAAFGALRQSLEAYESLPTSVSADDPPNEPIVHQASQVVSVETPVREAFLERVARFYDAGATLVERADAQSALDEWVRANTAGLIEKSGVVVKPNTRAVLQDAVLFAAAWRTPFDSEPPMDFHGPDGDTRVDAVSGSMVVPLAQGQRWTAVRLPYDEVLAADVIVPDEGIAPGDLTADEVREAAEKLAGAAADTVAVTMPVFDLKSTSNLLVALPELDLGNTDGIAQDTFIEQWVQQARLAVSAKGTVGAAVTEAVVAETSAQLTPTTFTVERPYVVRVLDTRTGWSLFLALISDPGA